MSPVPTASPAARSSREKFSMTETSGAGSGTGSDLFDVVPHQVQVVAFLDHGAERVIGGLEVEPGRAEEVERAHPVDRLGDPGRLGEVKLPQAVDGRHDLSGQRLGHTGLPDEYDLHLALGCRVADPVVQAASLQRVVQLAGPV